MRKDCQRSVEILRRTGPIVQTVGDGVEIVRREDTQIGARGQVLAQQTIVVLTGATLTEAVRIAEVDPSSCGCAQSLVPAHLHSLGTGEAARHGRNSRIQFGTIARQRRRCSGDLHLGQQHQTAGLLQQHAHGGHVARALDEIPLPVARHRPILDLWRAHVDTDHLGDLAPAIRATSAGQADATALFVQAGEKLEALFTARQGVNVGVDGVNGHVAPGSLGKNRLRVPAIC